ncbi:MAG: phenylalanine--tRNA ligase subunit alpha [Dehalococcoidia bacterium]
MLDQIEALSTRALSELDGIDGLEKLEEWRVRYLGRKSELVQHLRSLSDIPIEQRRSVGARANEIKQSLEAKLADKKESLERGLVSALREERLDVTLPGKRIPLGRLHITTQIINEICNVFRDMGFQIVEGPEVEWEYYNFEALNMPVGHPARDNFQTLWVNSAANIPGNSMLLRTHTSPVQIRTMEKNSPPIRIVAPGKAYRYEATDATHEWMFHQVEGFAIDKNITMADLKGTLFEFARRLFGRDRKFRFRVDYFPFVEPGGELAIDCFMCKGAGCRLCSNTGWLEILGCGMMHPEVLRYGNIDPEVYTGYAFGMGVERVAILRYGIEDIRLFYSNDLRFLRQF